MPLYLVRHAKAGSRQSYFAADDERPLTPAGHAQADAIAARFEGITVPRVLSSPYVRCVQTVAPLAARHALTVEPLALLAEGAAFEPVLELLHAAADGTVACTHGDVLPEVVDALIRRGMRVDGPVDQRKGVVWALERVGGVITSGYSTPPP